MEYFDWSFYSQGTKDQSAASADAFVAAALTFFGDAELATSPAAHRRPRRERPELPGARFRQSKPRRIALGA